MVHSVLPMLLLGVMAMMAAYDTRLWPLGVLAGVMVAFSLFLEN